MADYDLFVIGAGSGGVRASRMAARYGARVGICEHSRVGGTCVIRGCIPKKLFVYAAQVSEEIEDAAGFGWSVAAPSFDWSRLVANKDAEIDRLNAIYIRLLEEAGVDLHETRGELVDAHTVRLDGRTVSAETILVATGAWPSMPRIPGIEHAISSNEAFHLEALPRRAVVVGGGYVAVEFAGIFNGLGVEVIELYRGEQILRGFDDDVRDALAEEMRKKGIEVRVKSNVVRIDKAGESYRLTLEDGSALETDVVMYATGRRPSTEGFGLEAAGVELDDNGAVVVDDFSRTRVPNIYAIGDCTDRMNLTPVAIQEGAAFADTVYGGAPRGLDYAHVPSAVFSQPTVATVGLTEAQARARFGAVDIYRSTFRPLKHTLSGRDERTLMKLVVERASDRVVGCHIVGTDAAEIVQGLAIALV
ncbi:MAG: glutathione-disulfide reductase, partial [Alphaproteobacteria bacterium]|nr:glutathione-disulfide reductase [Alphaproteobacteria bacterium]